MKSRTLLMTLLAGIILATLAGCAAPPPPLEVLWPPPPDRPRLKWITTFSSEDNFPKTEQQLRVESIIGKQELHFFQKPAGIASAGDGVVYVADTDTGNIRVLDFNEKTNEFYSKEPIMSLPVGLALDSQRRLYVSDANRNVVTVFDPERKPLLQIGKGEFKRPTFLAVNSRLGRLYVSDVKKNMVLVFDLKGNKLFSFGTPGGGDGELFGPQGIAIDENDNVFVAEQFNARVQVFDADGKYVKKFGVRGDDAFQFEGPRGLAFDSEGHLYVAEARKAAVLIFDPDGQPLTSIGGRRSTHQLAFTLPSGIFVDPNDRVYISDSMNRSVTIWQYLNEDYLDKNPLNAEALKLLEQKVIDLQKTKTESVK